MPPRWLRRRTRRFLATSGVTLWEAHARWMPGKFDLTALYSHGSISNSGGRQRIETPGRRIPCPRSSTVTTRRRLTGAWEHGEYRLAPFVRWEYYTLGERYSGTDGPVVPAGLLPLSATPGDYGYWPAQLWTGVTTVGANFYTTPHVVFKIDIPVVRG